MASFKDDCICRSQDKIYMSVSIDQHNIEIEENLAAWNKKPLLRNIYAGFHARILKNLNKNVDGEVIELGSGIGNFKSAYPTCITTDIFSNPWIDRVESAYCLSFGANSVSHIILFDVFHHLAYPGSALLEAKRVLVRGGRVIIFDPYISLFGLFVYGLFHHEPVALFEKIEWLSPKNKNPDEVYYAAEGNATRIFGIKSHFKKEISTDWNIVKIEKFSALSYILSGGFSKPALYPSFLLPVLRALEKVLDIVPPLFATRVLVVLEKK